MSEKTAKTIVLLTGAFLFAAIGIKRSTIPDPYRYAWGAGLITLGLSVVADIAPEVAGPAALLVLFAVYMRNRGVVGSVLPHGPEGAALPAPLPGGFRQANIGGGAPAPHTTPTTGGKK